MGQVFLGRDIQLDRAVAVKFMSARAASAEERTRFLIEARAIARLAHPNVVSIYRVGEEQGWPYLVSELIEGQSLDKCAKPMPQDKVLRIGLGLAGGLAAAHEAGVLHRDIKPANVMLTPDGEAKLLDFGLAKLLRDTSLEGEGGTQTPEQELAPELTAAGMLIGTPLYLAPELWRTEPATVSSDVFSLGALLFELCVGWPPHAAGTLMQIRHLALKYDAPLVASVAPQVHPKLAAVIDRCLRRAPAARFASAQALYQALQEVQEALRPPPTLFGVPYRYALAAGVTVLSAILYGGSWLKQWLESDRMIRRLVVNARTQLSSGRDQATRAALAVQQATAAFDDRSSPEPAAAWQRAEQRWDEAMELLHGADASLVRASQALERALVLNARRAEVRALLAEVTYERLLLLERNNRKDAFGELRQRLDSHDDGGRFQRLLDAPAHLTIDAPGGMPLALQRFEGGRVYQAPVALGYGQRDAVDLPAGSYRLLAGPVSVPLLLRRGEAERVRLRPPTSVPAGYVYVPPGCFLFGSAEDDNVRRSFLKAPPLHRVCTAGYLIARHEVTFADWLEFLGALPPAERARRTPGSPQSQGRDMLRVSELPGGVFELRFQPGAQVYSARSGQPIHYAARRHNAVQDWLRFPVSCVSFEDALAYADWLGRSGRLPGARLCDEHEWERAARGADGRTFPHGEHIAPDDANYDETYGWSALGFGPDQVGLHPASESPFGVQDMAGNAFEWVRSVRPPVVAVTRGGSWYYGKLTLRSANREPEDATLRHIGLGLRVCADASGADGGGPP